MKLIEKYGKKKVMIAGVIALLVVLLGGTGIWYTMEQNYKKEVLASIDLIFKEDAFIEYGQEEVDFNAFIQETKGDPKVALPTITLDTKVLGKQELVYKLDKDGYLKDIPLSIEIRDTKAPEILFTSETLEITEGDEFDPVSNITSVKDPVDGDIEKSEDEALEKSGYLIKSDVDSSTPGDYKVRVTAYDINGNKSEKEYTVTVEKKAEVQQPKQPSNTGGSGGNTASGGNSSGNPSTNAGGSTAPIEPRYRTDISSSYVAQINAYRQQNGLATLPVTAEAQAEADMRAMQLVSNYAHNSSPDFIENIGNGGIGADFITAWKNSPGHNGTMLEITMFNAMAVSIVEYDGKWYAVTSFRTRF